MLILKYNLRSAMKRRIIAASVMAGSATTVFVVVASLMLLAGLEHAFALSGRDDVAVVLQHGAESEMSSVLPLDAVGRIATHAGAAQSAVGELVCVVTATKRARQDFVNVSVRGVTDDSVQTRPLFRLLEGKAPQLAAGEAIGRRTPVAWRDRRSVRSSSCRAGDGCGSSGSSRPATAPPSRRSGRSARRCPRPSVALGRSRACASRCPRRRPSTRSGKRWSTIVRSASASSASASWGSRNRGGRRTWSRRWRRWSRSSSAWRPCSRRSPAMSMANRTRDRHARALGFGRATLMVAFYQVCSYPRWAARPPRRRWD